MLLPRTARLVWGGREELADVGAGGGGMALDKIRKAIRKAYSLRKAYKALAPLLVASALVGKEDAATALERL